MGLDFGGAETHVMELCRELKRMGHDVHVASNGGVYVKDLEELDIPHYRLPLHERKISSMIASYRGLSKLIAEGNYDIVHGHARIPSFLCGLLKKKYDFRFVTTAHLDFAVTPLLRRMTDWGDGTIAVSNDIKTYLNREYGIDPKKVAVTVNGIDMQKFSPETDFSAVLEEFHLKKERRRIVYISRIDTDRSAPAFCLAELAPVLRKEFPDADIIIVGGGNDFDRLSALAEELNGEALRRGEKEPLITLTGPRSDIYRFTAAADIFCGVSRSALEAMSAACPVIVTGNQGHLGVFDRSCLKTAVETNFCCRGCPLPDKELLYRDLRRELRCTEMELVSQGQYNRETIAARYSVRKMAEDYIGFYRNLPYPADFKRSDVTVSGYYGFGNFGDDMILSSLIHGLREENPFVKITALANSPAETAKKYGIRCVDRFRPLAVFRTVKRSRAVVFGGGTLLQDKTSTKSLHYYANILRMTHIAGTPLYVYANGIGPLEHGSSRRLVKKVLGFADKITVREPDSLEVLQKLGIDAKKVSITADPVFLLPQADKEQGKLLLPDMRAKYFAVSLREFTAGTEGTENFENAMAGAIGDISKAYGWIPVFLPLQESNDIRICRAISERIPGSVLLKGLSPGELVSVLSCMELLIGMRLHSLIFGVKEGIPVVGLSYDPKIDAFMSYSGEKCCLTPGEVTAGALTDLVKTALSSAGASKDAVSVMKTKAQNEIIEITSFYRDRN